MDLPLLFAEAAKLGFIVLLLVFAVVYFARRADKQTESVAKALAASTQECVEREGRLASRLQLVEDRQHGEGADLIRQATSALEINAKTFDYLARRDTNLDRIK